MASANVKKDDYRNQILCNIKNMANEPHIDLSVVFNQEKTLLLKLMFDHYTSLGFEKYSLLNGLLTAMSGLSNLIKVKDPLVSHSSGINLYSYIIGEGGSFKSKLIQMIRSNLIKMMDLFPDMLQTTVGGKKQSFLVQPENENSLYKKLAIMGDVFLISDEMEVLLNNLSLFSPNHQNNPLGEKLLCQAFDGIQNETRHIGNQTFTICDAKMTMLGAGSGERYAKLMEQFDSNIGNDSPIARINFIIMPTLSYFNNIDYSSETKAPSVLHCLIVVHLLGLERIEFRFQSCTNDSQIGSHSNVDDDDDSSISNSLTACELFKQIVEADFHEASLNQDKKNYVSNFLRKSLTKLARLAANLELLNLSMCFCKILSDHVDFDHENDPRKSNILKNFIENVKQLIKMKLEMAPKTNDGKFIFFIHKDTLLAAEMLYKNIKDVGIRLFSADDVQSIVINRMLKAAETREKFANMRKTTKMVLDEKYIMLSMESPFLMSSWFSNCVHGIKWTGQWRREVDVARNLIKSLVEKQLLEPGMFFVTAKDKSYMKATPDAIDRDAVKTQNLFSMRITLDQYRTAYRAMKIPMSIRLSQTAVERITNSADFIPYFHLYPQLDIRMKVEQLLKKNIVKEILVDGTRQYTLVDPNQTENWSTNQSTHLSSDVDISTITSNDHRTMILQQNTRQSESPVLENISVTTSNDAHQNQRPTTMCILDQNRLPVNQSLVSDIESNQHSSNSNKRKHGAIS